MKKFLLLILLVFSCGCDTWIQRYRTDPWVALTDDVGTIQTALGMASSAVSAWAAANPGSGASETLTRFAELSGHVQQGLGVAQAGIRLAANAGRDPNVVTLLQDSRTAIGEISSFLSGLGLGPGHAVAPLMQNAIQATREASRAASR